MGKRKTNLYIKGFAYLFILLFLVVILYLCYFTWIKAPELVNSPYNGRLDKLNESTYRGEIVSADGDVLAYSELDDEGNESRVYHYGNAFSHIVGYTEAGEAGLESYMSYSLVNSHESVVKRFLTELKNKKVEGDRVVTTLDTDLQQLVSDAMGNNRGACVVMDPKTGDILASVSKPDFDPNTIKKDYEKLLADDSNSCLVNRVFKGLYCPGSTFKIVTTLGYLEQFGDEWKDYEYHCAGSITEADHTVKCSHGNAHGTEDLMTSFAKSCNCSFINLGLSLNLKEFQKTCEKLMFNTSIPTIFPVSTGQYVLNTKTKASTPEIMQTVFGQGDTLITPLQNAMIVSAVANDGVMMNPRLVTQLESASGDVVETYEPESLGSVMSADNASIIGSFMEEVVRTGTATVLQSDRYQAAAKTGSAQTSTGKETDAWLVAYAPADDPQVVVSIVLEEGGAGSTAAGPIVKKIFDSLID